MTGPRVLFRCEAGPAIGIGHAARCLALAQELVARHGAACVALARAPCDLIGWREAGFATLRAAVAEPAAELLAAKASHPDLVVVDLPGLRPADVLPLAAMPWPLALFDDSGTVPVATHFLINGNAFARSLPYRVVRPDARRLLGPRYLALRPALRAARRRRRTVAARGERVLLTLGGGERSAVLEAALAALPPTVAVDLVLGPFTSAIAGRLDDCVRVHRAPAQLVDLLLAADLCVAGGGMTLYEAACLGTPTVALPQNALEARNAAALAARGVVVDLGPERQAWKSSLGPTVQGLLQDASRRRALARAGRRLVDGRGAERLADALVAGVGA